MYVCVCLCVCVCVLVCAGMRWSNPDLLPISPTTHPFTNPLAPSSSHLFPTVRIVHAQSLDNTALPWLQRVLELVLYPLLVFRHNDATNLSFLSFCALSSLYSPWVFSYCIHSPTRFAPAPPTPCFATFPSSVIILTFIILYFGLSPSLLLTALPRYESHRLYSCRFTSVNAEDPSAFLSWKLLHCYEERAGLQS